MRFRASFRLPVGFVAVMPEGSAGLGNEFGAAAFNEIAGFGDDALQEFYYFAETGLAVDDAGDVCNHRRGRRFSKMGCNRFRNRCGRSHRSLRGF
jgi:hypothetical protein